ncbi:M15 family metallopeptidase [Staphylococcus americanisciuri]|uniref:M15 family metallopeptidase n=1 Tax=Staphylococcus americanisciuri TaxID=2973940 RepID=A0ABT2F372_9STAP|nr:M15 family metallopeptidase [Staphylococcus americanisciuri]MCS4486901.1 M15 family metallopeptidase [Staphylococcus americanisciuri]
MKKLLLTAGVFTFVLPGCGVQKEANVQEATTDEETRQEETKKQHQVTKKDGVMYVDGHVFANKKVNLPNDYAPGEDPKARAELNRMMQDANTKDGTSLVFCSGFRSYETQTQLYNNYVARDGEAVANKYSAKPGNSEHQTGLAFDVGSANASDDFQMSFVETKEGQWVKAHAHEYGFIIRYPEGKEKVTGYQYEPWHLRYVGKDLAQKIHDQNTTLEEYFNYGM